MVTALIIVIITSSANGPAIASHAQVQAVKRSAALCGNPRVCLNRARRWLTSTTGVHVSSVNSDNAEGHAPSRLRQS